MGGDEPSPNVSTIDVVEEDEVDLLGLGGGEGFSLLLGLDGFGWAYCYFH